LSITSANVLITIPSLAQVAARISSLLAA